MSNHVKPSKEELQANIDASLKNLDTTPPEPPKAGDEPPAIPPATPPTPPKADDTTPPEPQKAGDEPPATPPATQDVDWEKKFSASSREAQVQGFKLKAINEAYEEASKITDITEEELKKENPDWEDMTDTEKRLAKSILITAKKNDIVNSAINKFRDVDEWDGKISTFIEDPKTLIAHPELEGKAEEFKSFASKPTRRGVEFEDLVLAFSGEQAKNKPAPKKGEMFPTGSGGQKDPPKPKSEKLSPTESRALMQSDYKKWKELLLAGKIANE
jgi:hypothetical protein